MRSRIGLALARDAVRAVALPRHQIVWAAEAPLEPGATLASVIESLLAAAPVRRFPRPIVSAAVGPHASQVRLVTGLPDGQDAQTLAAIIRENASLFFLKNGVPLITTDVRPADAGVALAAAIDEPYVAAVRDACAGRWRLSCIAPTPIALVRAFEDRSFSWMDGTVVVEVTRSDDAIESVRTRRWCATEPVASPPHPVPALASFGESALRYADAYGAAVMETPPALGLDALATGAWTPSEARRRLLLPGLVIALGIASFALSPLAAARAAGGARARLAAVRDDQKQTVLSTLNQLDRVSAILEDTRQFAESRSPITLLLGELARVLPERSVLASLELGDEQGQLVALSSNAAAVLAAVQRLPGARSVELVGAVQREAVAGSEAQRVTVRWRRGLP